ncbi:MAG: hypothetical protein NTW33_01855 [Methanoregula sp.]|nr:hypothetical protein [Methanoregula sp.]
MSDEHWVWTVKLILETYCPRITFSCEETPERPIFICEDDGVRISPKDKARLFDRLVGENIRFGLFFILECLLRSGMTIAETSTPGKGARFEIAVPKGMYRFTSITSKLIGL